MDEKKDTKIAVPTAEEVAAMELLTRDEIKRINDYEGLRERAYVPIWKRPVLIQGMKSIEKDQIEDSGPLDANGRRGIALNFRAKVAIACCINEDGSKMFDQRDEGWLGSKSAAAMDIILPIGLRLSGWTERAREEIAGNSERGQEDDSNIE